MHRQLTELKMKQINELNQLKCPNYYNSQFPLFCQIYTKNQAGLKDLYHLISISYTEQFFREPTIFIDQINAVRKNFVIASSPFWGDV
jgi:DNA polymerase-3 subunit alpha (Gram-positive type)